MELWPSLLQLGVEVPERESQANLSIQEVSLTRRIWSYQEMVDQASLDQTSLIVDMLTCNYKSVVGEKDKLCIPTWEDGGQVLALQNTPAIWFHGFLFSTIFCTISTSQIEPTFKLFNSNI